jgi:hypothetical protein
VATKIVRAMAFAVAGMGVAQGVYSQSAVECDRGCLTGFVDQYLKAMVAHEPSKAQLSKTAKITENGQVLKAGDGLWNTISEDASYRLYVADPDAGQAGFLGVVKENGTPVIVALRLKVEKKEITQAETIVARNEPGSPFRPELLINPKPVFAEILSEDERLPRENMLGIVNAYFDGLDEYDNARRVAFDKDCQRVENGVEMTSVSDPGADPMRRLNCADQLNTGWSKIITAVRERRFSVVDAERGLVFATALFDHAGLLKAVKLNDGTTLGVPAGAQRPTTHMIAGIYKIKDRRLRQVETVLVPVPYGMKSGWTR